MPRSKTVKGESYKVNIMHPYYSDYVELLIFSSSSGIQVNIYGILYDKEIPISFTPKQCFIQLQFALLSTIYIYKACISMKHNETKAMRYSEISHYSHPQHKLKLDLAQLPFKCDGCKEIGIGSCYKCSSCDYDLHMHCAIPTPSIYHPFYPKCSFIFMSKPPGNVPRYCNACERPVTGFLYHCNSCGFDLHPCCAKLPTVLDDGSGMLFLYRKVSGPCQRCGKKGRSWTYRSSDKKYNLHVACVKDMLIESWHELYYGRGLITTTTIGDPNSISSVPGLKGALLQTHSHSKYNSSKSKGKVQKCCEMAGMTLQFVISAVLGDPTSLIAGVVGSLMTR